MVVGRRKVSPLPRDLIYLRQTLIYENTTAQDGGEDKEEDGGKGEQLRLRLEINLDIEIQLKAKIHGDLTIGLL